MTHSFTYRRRVEFAETDTAGVAHFAGFFRWMEEAEHALYRSVGGAAYRWEPDRVMGMPRVSASCEYLRPVRYGDEIEVQLVVREKSDRSIAYEVEFRRVVGGDDQGDGEDDDEAEVVARGSMRVVHVVRPHGAREWRTTELPEVLQESLRPAPPVREGSHAPGDRVVRFDVFGRVIEVVRNGGEWRAYYIGAEGKRRAADDVLIPSSIAAPDLPRYLADLFHESASPDDPEVKRLDP